MERNSAYDTRRRIQDEAMVKFDAMCAPSGVMMLHLCECKELEVVDLSGFRKLRWLSIWECLKIREIIGWECLEELGWLGIYSCPFYDGLQMGDETLSSIRGLEGLGSLTVLELHYVGNAFRNLPDLGHMKYLTHLAINGSAVEEIKGVEKLSSLEELDCSYSKLKTLSDLRHLPHLQYVSLNKCPVVKDPSSPYYKRDYVLFDRENKHVDVSDTSDSE